MKNTNSKLVKFLVERDEFTRNIGFPDSQFLVNYVSDTLTAGTLLVNNSYVCLVDIWHDSKYVELVTRDCCENEIAIIEKLFKGGWAE